MNRDTQGSRTRGTALAAARTAAALTLAVTTLSAPPAAAAPTANGLAVYGNNTTTPQYEAYQVSTNTFPSAAAAAGAAAAANPTYLVDRAAPTRSEHVAGYVTTGGVLYVLRWNGTTWSNEWNVTVGGAGANGRRFDIAYESASGRAVVVYSTNATGATAELAYRVWDGATWTAAATIQSALLTGAANWIKLAPRVSGAANEIMLAAVDTNRVLTTFLWAASAWGGEPAAAHSTAVNRSVTAGDLDSVDLAAESASGDFLLVWSDGTNVSARPYTTSWGTASTTVRNAWHVVAAADPDPTSDRVLVAYNANASANVYGRVWSGAALGAERTVATNGVTPAVNQKTVAAGYLLAGTTRAALVLFQDNTATNARVSYASSTDDGATFTAANATVTGPTSTKRWMEAETDPAGGETLMLAFSDGASDLWAKRLVFAAPSTFTWTDADGGTALTATLTNVTTQNFSFAYDRFFPRITVGNGADPANATIVPGMTAPLDAFTVQSNGETATITGVTVNLPANASALSNLSVNGAADCLGTSYGALGAAPVNGDNAIPLSTSIAATTGSGGTSYYVCVTGATVGASTAVAGNVSAVTSAGYLSTDGDTAGATVTVVPAVVTIGNGADPANASITKDGTAPLDAFTLQANGGTASVTAVTVSVAGTASALANLSINDGAACNGTTYGSLGAAPVVGNNTITLGTGIAATTATGATNYYVCATAGTVGATASVTGNVASVAALGYTSSDGDTGGPQLTVTVPPNVAIGNGASEPPNASVRPGETAALDAFTLQASAGTATVAAVTVNLTNGTALSGVSINDGPTCGGATYGTLGAVVNGNNTVSLGTAITAGTAASTYYVCASGGPVAASTAVTGNVASVSALGYTSSDGDTTNATVTVILGTLTIGNGADPAAASISQGGVAALDAFTLQTGGGSASVTSVTVSIPVNASALSNLSVNSAATCDGTSYGALGAAPVVGNNAIALGAPLPASTTSGATSYYVCATAAAVGTNTQVTGDVAAVVAAGYGAAVDADTTGATITVTPPPNVAIGNGASEPAAASVPYGGTAALDAFTLQASAGTATVGSVTVNLTNGAALFSVSINSAQTCAGTQYGARDPVSNGAFAIPLTTPIAATTTAATYYVCVTGGSAGASTNVTGTVASVSAFGYVSSSADTTSATVTVQALAPGGAKDTRAPMVSIVNPSSGAVVSPDTQFKVQIRVFNPAGAPNGIAGVTSVQLSTDAGATWTLAATKSPNYDTGAPTTGATYEALVSGLAPRGYTLRARATNGVPITTVSEPLQVVVGAAKQGDGNLLRRDDASQLCSDCHAFPSHSSEAMKSTNASVEGSGSKYGAWSATCRDCHTPHGSRNIQLVRETITPPSPMGGQPSRQIGFVRRTGDSAAAGWDAANGRPTANGSFVNSDGSGPCQACHTRTTDAGGRIRNDGNFTSGSANVTAVASVFTAGAAPTGDVGKFVVGPDGGQYQISAVVSGTQATLATAYQGATTTPANTAYFVVGSARWRNGATNGNTDTHYTASTRTSACTGCHAHGKGFGAGESTGGGACAGCHSDIAAMVAGTDAVGTGAQPNKHSLVGYTDTFTDVAPAAGDWGTVATLSQVPPAQRSCVNMCHADHPHDLTSPVLATHDNNLYADPSTQASRANASAARTSANRAKADFDPTTGGGMCTKCHAKPIAAGRPTVADAAYAAGAHNRTSTSNGATTFTWEYALHDGGKTQRNCTKCHASAPEGNTPSQAGTAVKAVHGTSDPSLLAGPKRPNGVAAGFVCYNCHGSAAPVDGGQGNRSGKNIQAQIAKARNHPAIADGVHDTTTELANAAFGNTLGVTGRHSSCMDCHDSHAAKAGTHATTTNVAGPPLEGAWGAQLSASPAFWTNPTSASFTKKTIVAGSDAEATLCFKCHSSFYGTLPTSPSGGYAETDTAKEFNPNNAGNWFTTGTTTTWTTGETAGGFHPVLATAGNNLGAVNMTNLVTTNIPWRTSGARNLMTCTDCHESETATDPNGPHGSTAGFILRGPNTTWAQTITLGSTIPAGTFCLNCHQNNYTGTRFPDHTRSNHFVACWNCHARIPHGGPRPGILVAGAGAGANVGGTMAGWDQTAPYWGGTASNRLYLVSYPSSSTGSWAQSNCGCNGTGH